MSAIGDYIHYTSSGYFMAGVNKRGKTNVRYESQLATAFNNQRRVVSQQLYNQNPLSVKEKQELEKSITTLMTPDTGDKGLDQLWGKLEEAFFNEFQDCAVALDRKHAEIFRPGYADNQALGLTRIRKTDRGVRGEQKTGNISQTRLSTIMKRVDLLNAAIKNVEQSSKNNGGTYLQKLKEQMRIICQNLSFLLNSAQEAMKQVNYPELKDLIAKNYPNTNSILFDWKDAKPVITEVNRMINMVNSVQNLQKGTLFQMIIAFAPLVGKGYSEKQLKKVVDSVVGTSGKSTVKFDPKDFYLGVNLDKILNAANKGSYKLNDNLYESVIASQNKIDVVLNWKGKEINVSAKNLNMNPGAVSPYIHLVSQSSLLALLTSMSPDFVNHYLNMISTHKYTKNKLIQLQDIPQYQETKDLLKLSLLASAFVGYKKDTSKANIFIVNDNTSGKVRIYDINSLVNKIYTEGLLDKQAFLIEPAIENIILNNRFMGDQRSAEGATQRIQNVLSQIHGYKISVKFKKSILTGI